MKIILLAFNLLVTDPIQVLFYGEQCKLEATYSAEQVHVSKEGIVTMYFEDGSTFNVPLRYVLEAQVRFHAFLRAYSYEDGRVIERTTPKCGGSV